MSKYRQQEAKTIENTELYKTQYEELLHEYNQYLEDLEAVQAKLKGLESLKTTYEEENSSLRALCERYQSKADEMQARVEEVEVIMKYYENPENYLWAKISYSMRVIILVNDKLLFRLLSLRRAASQTTN